MLAPRPIPTSAARVGRDAASAPVRAGAAAMLRGRSIALSRSPSPSSSPWSTGSLPGGAAPDLVLLAGRRDRRWHRPDDRHAGRVLRRPGPRHRAAGTPLRGRVRAGVLPGRVRLRPGAARARPDAPGEHDRDHVAGRDGGRASRRGGGQGRPAGHDAQRPGRDGPRSSTCCPSRSSTTCCCARSRTLRWSPRRCAWRDPRRRARAAAGPRPPGALAAASSGLRRPAPRLRLSRSGRRDSQIGRRARRAGPWPSASRTSSCPRPALLAPALGAAFTAGRAAKLNFGDRPRRCTAAAGCTAQRRGRAAATLPARAGRPGRPAAGRPVAQGRPAGRLGVQPVALGDCARRRRHAGRPGKGRSAAGPAPAAPAVTGRPAPLRRASSRGRRRSAALRVARAPRARPPRPPAAARAGRPGKPRLRQHQAAPARRRRRAGAGSGSQAGAS